MSKAAVDFEVDKAQKEKIEQSMIELRKDVRCTYQRLFILIFVVSGPELSKGFLEDDEDYEREAERRIMRAKRGKPRGAGRAGRGRVRKREQYEREVSNSEEEEEELLDDEEIEEDYEEPKVKRQRF
jgi:hypothetical protein